MRRFLVLSIALNIILGALLIVNPTRDNEVVEVDLTYSFDNLKLNEVLAFHLYSYGNSNEVNNKSDFSEQEKAILMDLLKEIDKYKGLEIGEGILFGGHTTTTLRVIDTTGQYAIIHLIMGGGYAYVILPDHYDVNKTISHKVEIPEHFEPLIRKMLKA